MAHRLYRGEWSNPERLTVENPLQTVACHEDLSATDLVGRFLLRGDETIWQDGPLTRSVKEGAICYLDEIVEARKDSTVLIHSLTDHRRILPVEKQGLILDAHKNFLLVISYNPGYQNVLKDLKPSTRQRFIAIDFDYPGEEQEANIIVHESGIDSAMALELAMLGARIRNLRQHGFDEGVSTRLLVYAAQLITRGVSPLKACDAAICRAVSDDIEVQHAIAELVTTVFPTD
jgi:nitric oxide reductase NorQ protein